MTTSMPSRPPGCETEVVPSPSASDGEQLTGNGSTARMEGQIRDLERRVDEALASDTKVLQGDHRRPRQPEQVIVWGVPFSRLTLSETLQHIERLIQFGEPSYFITANLNYNMLTAQYADLKSINERASFIVCDGMPMVWWSKLRGRPLPERVAGSELIYALTKWAAVRGHRVFFLGGAPGVAKRAADKLQARYPGLEVAGVESPPFRPLTKAEETNLTDRIRSSGADIVYVALGQPKGERWIACHYRSLGGAICVQLGASFDFVAGGVPRAPRWIQRIGMEWFYRMLQEPKRLFRRYWRNGWFMLRAIFREMILRRS